MKNEYTKAVIEKADSGTFTAIASTAMVDRHGESVDQAGWDLSNFKKNPVLLWAHDHSEPAVGSADKVWVDGIGKKAKLMIQGKIHEATDKAKAIKYLVENGIIKTMSVGYRLLEANGEVHTKQELLEVSFVNVPANSQAMITAYKSLNDQGFKKEVMSDLGMPVELLEKMNKLEQDVNELKTLVKAPESVNPKTMTEKRISMLKVVAKAADTLMRAEKTHAKVERKRMVKVIKRATETLIVAEKENLNG